MYSPTQSLSAVILLLAVSPLATAGLGDVEYGTTYVAFHAVASPGGSLLRLSGPGGFAEDICFEAGQTPVLDLYDVEGHPLEDGLYRWELRPVAAARDRSGSGPAASAPGAVSSGAFTVLGGALVDPERPETLLTKDQVILDDLIVDGSLCVGFDCVIGESFGFDTIRLKESNLRIHFDDTSTSGSFPSNDWRIAINDTQNGGQSRFSIEDATAATTVFTIAAGAPEHSLYVDGAGDVGIGTSTPVANVHLVDGNTPTLRLEQDGSGGFNPQVWDVAGNEASFFVRDATNGSSLPFRILAGAPSNALRIESDGDVTVGGLLTADAIRSSTLEIGAAVTWRQEVDDEGSYVFDDAGDGLAEMIIEEDGDVLLQGHIKVKGIKMTSDRDLKTGIVPLDGRDVLTRVAALPISAWSFNDELGERHIGPMAQDFHAAFGLGDDDRHISPLDASGVALAAIQGLHAELAAKRVEVEALRQQNVTLASRLAALEARVARLALSSGD